MAFFGASTAKITDVPLSSLAVANGLADVVVKPPDTHPRPLALNLVQKLGESPPEPPEAELEYERLADELGFAPRHIAVRRRAKAAALRRRNVVEFLLDSGLPLYDNQAVGRYMDGLCIALTRSNHFHTGSEYTWEWVALRKKDAPHFGYPLYQHLVPMEMLQRVKTISAKFPTAIFAVTDYAAVNPDPFICFRTSPEDHEQYVFGVWDEPGFGLPGGAR